MPEVPTQIRESMPIDQHTHTTYVDDYDPPKKSKKSWEEEEVQDNNSREEEVKDNTHVQKVSRRTSAQILKGKKNILDSTHDLKQQRKRGAIFVEDQDVVKDQLTLKKKKKIVAEVKPQEAVPDKKEHVTDSELQNSPMVDDESDQEDEDDFLDDIMPMTKKCNMDIVYRELEKEPKFKNVSDWLKGIKEDVILPTVEPTVQAIVPGFVSTEAVGKLGVGSKLPEFVPPESMGNVGAGSKLPGFVPPESMGNLGGGTKLPRFVPPESLRNLGAGRKLPEFVPNQTVGNFGAGAKLPGLGSTFRMSSSSPGIEKECSPVYTQIQKMLRTHTSETPTPRASLPLDVEIMQQEEQKQQEVHVDEVLELNIASKREELIEPQRDESKSSYGPLEMSEFKQYLTGDNDTEQKNINDGAAILTATFTGDDNDGIAVQKSPVKDDISNVTGRNSGDEERIENSYSVQESRVKDHIPNAQHDIENATGRISGDEERIENSYSVQDSGVKDDILNAKDDIANAASRNSRDTERVESTNSVEKSRVEDEIANAKVDIGNTAGRNSRDAGRVENSNSKSSNSDEEHANPTTKDENPTTKEENLEVKESETGDSKSISSSEEEGMVIAKVENPEDEQNETSEAESNDTDGEDAMDSEPENVDDEKLEEDSESDSSSLKEEDLVGNNSGNPEDVSKPEQPKKHEQLNIANFEKSGEQEDTVAEKINEPGGRFVNYFSASHRIPKALDVMRAKGNVIPLSEI